MADTGKEGERGSEAHSLSLILVHIHPHFFVLGLLSVSAEHVHTELASERDKERKETAEKQEKEEQRGKWEQR